MKTTEAVREIMKEQGIGITQIAKRMDKPTRLVWDRLSMDNISIVKLNEMLRVLDYKAVIIPQDVKVPKGGFEIE